MRFLLLGLGSIGSKHCSILKSLGHEVVTVDPDLARDADYQDVTFDVGNFDGTLDCTLPDIRAGWDVYAKNRFIEKPLGSKTPSLITHKPPGRMIGFCYHYLPSLSKFVATIKAQPLAHLLIVGGQNIQDWHAQDYRLRKYDGVATDSLPHSLYIARWILGDYSLVGSCVGKFSDLEIETEDTAGVLLRSNSGIPCYIEVDYLRDPRLFYIEAITAQGQRHYWEFDPAEAPEMYQRQMQAFIRLCAGEDVSDYPNLADGTAVQKVLDEVTM